MPRILIVDDHEFVRATLCKLIKLDEPAWQLSEASDGSEAVEVFRRTAPEVVVLDIVMDGMTGLEAAWRMREISPEAKIVFISSQFTTRDACGMARLFAGAFVPKSEAGRALIPTIKRLLTVH
jgi:NarL family two-component system response regulator LiaR